MPYTNAGLPFQSQSDTSRDAALAVERFVGEQGETVYAWLAERPDGTQKEASASLGIGRPSICARFHALEAAGRIVKLKHRRDGCAVYIVRP